MTTVYAIAFKWIDGVMVPLNPRLAAKQYRDGETYRLEPREERSGESHRHYFAAIKEAWQNLPEELAADIPSPEHLRKWALIRAGFCDRRSVVCDSVADAVKFKAFIKPMDEFAVVTAEARVVTVYTAQSQSMKSMGKKKFQESKTKVLDICAGLIGVSTETLEANTAKAA